MAHRKLKITLVVRVLLALDRAGLCLPGDLRWSTEPKLESVATYLPRCCCPRNSPWGRGAGGHPTWQAGAEGPFRILSGNPQPRRRGQAFFPRTQRTGKASPPPSRTRTMQILEPNNLTRSRLWVTHASQECKSHICNCKSFGSHIRSREKKYVEWNLITYSHPIYPNYYFNIHQNKNNKWCVLRIFLILNLQHQVCILYPQRTSAHTWRAAANRDGTPREGLRVYLSPSRPSSRTKGTETRPITSMSAAQSTALSQTPSATKTGLQSFDGRGEKHSANI